MNCVTGLQAGRRCFKDGFQHSLRPLQDLGVSQDRPYRAGSMKFPSSAASMSRAARGSNLKCVTAMRFRPSGAVPRICQ